MELTGNNTTPSPWAALRRTRRQLIGVSILLGLWLLLVLCYMRIVAPEIDFDFHSKWGRLDRIFIFTFAGFVLSHAIVGLKLLQLIKASGKPGMESDPREAATAFTVFWKTNLWAHAILWVWIVLLSVIVIIY